MRPCHSARTLAVLAVMTLSLTSCGPLSFGGNTLKPTLNQQQATDRIERYIHDALTAFAPLKPELEPFGMTNVPCDDPDDGGPQGRVTLADHYFLRDLPPGYDTAPLFDQMLGYWKREGFVVMRDERPTTQSISVQHPVDGFEMGLDRGADGTISISASSPCIWPAGHPVPNS